MLLLPTTTSPVAGRQVYTDLHVQPEEPGLLFAPVCDKISGFMWLERDSTSWMMKALILLSGLHVPFSLDGNKPLGQQISHVCHVALPTVELTDALIQVWEEIWDLSVPFITCQHIFCLWFNSIYAV